MERNHCYYCDCPIFIPSEKSPYYTQNNVKSFDFILPWSQMTKELFAIFNSETELVNNIRDSCYLCKQERKYYLNCHPAMLIARMIPKREKSELKCFYCKSELFTGPLVKLKPAKNRFSRDHIMPQAYFNNILNNEFYIKNDINNYRSCCQQCNNDRAQVGHCPAAMIIANSYKGGFKKLKDWYSAQISKAEKAKNKNLAKNIVYWGKKRVNIKKIENKVLPKIEQHYKMPKLYKAEKLVNQRKVERDKLLAKAYPARSKIFIFKGD